MCRGLASRASLRPGITRVGDRLCVTRKVIPIRKNHTSRAVDERIERGAWRMMQALERDRVCRIKHPHSADRWQTQILFTLREMRLSVVRAITCENDFSALRIRWKNVVIRRLIGHSGQHKLHVFRALHLRRQRDLVKLNQKKRCVGRTARLARGHAENWFRRCPVDRRISHRHRVGCGLVTGYATPVGHRQQIHHLRVGKAHK